MAHLPRLTDEGDVSYVDEAGLTHASYIPVSYEEADGETQAVTPSLPMPIVAAGDSRDDISDALIVVDYAHHEAHEGDAFETSAVDESMGDGDTVILAFKTMSAPKRMHMIMEFATLVGGHIDIIEGPTWDNQTGTLNPIYNRKREAEMGSSGVLEDQGQASFIASDNMILDPTTFAGGTAIHTHFVFGARGSPASARGVHEWLLKPDTQYGIRLTADGAANAAHMRVEWYEHSDSN